MYIYSSLNVLHLNQEYEKGEVLVTFCSRQAAVIIYTDFYEKKKVTSHSYDVRQTDLYAYTCKFGLVLQIERVVVHQNKISCDHLIERLKQTLFSINFLSSSSNLILVHCSAGVGRTGTFIALYKLIEDYYNCIEEREPHNMRRLSLIKGESKYLDVYDTVLQMRYQRRKMVQKQEQYLYVYRCLRDEVKSEEGGYYQI